jgi:hypothetical protein
MQVITTICMPFVMLTEKANLIVFGIIVDYNVFFCYVVNQIKNEIRCIYIVDCSV